MTDRKPLSKERLQEIFIEGFEEGRQRQIARRAAQGLPPVSKAKGFVDLGALAPEIAKVIIRHDEDLTPRPLAPKNVCTSCGGAGWVADRGGPGLFPTYNPCRDCADIVTSSGLERRLTASGIIGGMRTKTFQSFVPRHGAEAAVAAASRWAAEYARAQDRAASEGRWLVLRGDRGSGKTHLALAAANVLIDQGYPVRWCHTLDLIDQARSLYDGEGSGEGRVLALRRELASAPILIMDEFGALSAVGTDWARSRFVEPLLDQRYRESKPTLFTLKGTPEQVREHISDSVGRRMEDMEICTVVEITAGQYLK